MNDNSHRRGERAILWWIKIFTVTILITNMTLQIGCLPVFDLPVTPTETKTVAITSTPTIVWFPPTLTPTHIATSVHSPTPERRPGIEKIIFSENFDDSEHWLTGNMDSGTIAVGIKEISLAITKPKGYLYSFRYEPIVDDFYAEITATPSLCTGDDEYGLLIRYNSSVDYYRYSLSCNGQTRLDKIVGGTASSPQPWLQSASIPTASPSYSRLGVWADGSEMRFFINDEFQFEVNDPTLSQGLIGVFVRSGGENAVTVSFSDLNVYQILE